jgi:tRNA dimethylallyltransferase
LRATLKARALQEGWEALHAFLASIDPAAAARIQPQDSQRIQRALEVYMLTGKTISAWQAENTSPLLGYRVHNLALIPSDRARLHERIAQRFQQMLELGLIEEVRRLYDRGDLSAELPSIRSVGYRQVWAYLSGQISEEEMREKAIVATRQLAKRQITWLRSWPDVTVLDSESDTIYAQAAEWLRRI